MLLSINALFCFLVLSYIYYFIAVFIVVFPFKTIFHFWPLRSMSSNFSKMATKFKNASQYCTYILLYIYFHIIEQKKSYSAYFMSHYRRYAPRKTKHNVYASKSLLKNSKTQNTSLMGQNCLNTLKHSWNDLRIAKNWIENSFSCLHSIFPFSGKSAI